MVVPNFSVVFAIYLTVFNGSLQKDTFMALSSKQKQISSRLEMVISNEMTSYRMFALNVGIDPSNFKKKINNELPWTMKDLNKMASSGINSEWLLEGIGEMPKLIKRNIGGVTEVKTKPLMEPAKLTEGVVKETMRPRYSVYANAGVLTEAIESDYENFHVVEQLPKYNFTIIIRGDSMEPTFHSGDEIACLDVKNTSFRQWGKPHVLNTSQGVVLKRIYQGERGYICKSDNENYPPFEVPEEEVYSIAMVVGLLRSI